MTKERFKDIYSLGLQKCADHPLHTSRTCQVCKALDEQKRRIHASHHELIKQPCEIHKQEVFSTCPECLLWAAHGGVLQIEKEIDFSVTKPDNKALAVS